MRNIAFSQAPYLCNRIVVLIYKYLLNLSVFKLGIQIRQID